MGSMGARDDQRIGVLAALLTQSGNDVARHPCTVSRDIT
jgi:hypothetical protein